MPCHAIARCHCSTRLQPVQCLHLLSLSRRPWEPLLSFARRGPLRLVVLGHRGGHMVQGSSDKHTGRRMNNSREPSSIATLPGDWVSLREFQSPSLGGDYRPVLWAWRQAHCWSRLGAQCRLTGGSRTGGILLQLEGTWHRIHTLGHVNSFNSTRA